MTLQLEDETLGQGAEGSQYPGYTQHHPVLDGVAPLIADPPPANSPTMHGRLVRQDKQLCPDWNHSTQYRVLDIGLDMNIYPPSYHGLPVEVCWKYSL